MEYNKYLQNGSKNYIFCILFIHFVADDDMSIHSPDPTQLTGLSSSPFNLHYDWTPARWFETAPSVSRVHLGPVSPSILVTFEP